MQWKWNSWSHRPFTDWHRYGFVIPPPSHVMHVSRRALLQIAQISTVFFHDHSAIVEKLFTPIRVIGPLLTAPSYLSESGEELMATSCALHSWVAKLFLSMSERMLSVPVSRLGVCWKSLLLKLIVIYVSGFNFTSWRGLWIKNICVLDERRWVGKIFDDGAPYFFFKYSQGDLIPFDFHPISSTEVALQPLYFTTPFEFPFRNGCLRVNTYIYAEDYRTFTSIAKRKFDSIRRPVSASSWTNEIGNSSARGDKNPHSGTLLCIYHIWKCYQIWNQIAVLFGRLNF